MKSMTTTRRTAPADHPAARADRRDMFLSYGFTLEQAELLTAARDGLWPLHHLKVKRALDAGATHELAVEMFA
jgi:hypothetical protein